MIIRMTSLTYYCRQLTIMTRFSTYHFSGRSIIHTAAFYSNSIEYEISLTKINEFNISNSTIIFPSNYCFSESGCWEISFDTVENMVNKTLFQSPPSGSVNSVQVFRTVVNIILDHYTQFNGGMYGYLPNNDNLAAIYRKLINNRLGKGITLEVGLDPERRGNVLRTPKCYRKTFC